MTELPKSKRTGGAVSETGRTRIQSAWSYMISPGPLLRPIYGLLACLGLAALSVLKLVMDLESGWWLLVSFGWFLYFAFLAEEQRRKGCDWERSPQKASDQRGYERSGEAFSEAGKTQPRSAWSYLIAPGRPVSPFFLWRGFLATVAVLGLAFIVDMFIVQLDLAWWYLLCPGCVLPFLVVSEARWWMRYDREHSSVGAPDPRRFRAS